MADHSTLTKPSPNLLPFSYTRKTMFFAYGFMLTFLICTIFILFNPTFHSSPLEILANFRNRSFLSSQNGSHIFSYHFPKSSHSNSGNNVTSNVADPPFFTNGTNDSNFSTSQDGNFDAVPAVNQTQSSNFLPVSETQNSDEVVVGGTLGNSSICGNDTTQVMKRDEEGSEFKGEVAECNIFDGNWVRDETYPLYEPGSCPHIDEPFNCFLNHRPDNGYERYRWQPNDCNIPRLNGTHMLELLRGKRLVFVGDSLNRNMWESLVCILRNSVEDKRTVFEASGRQEFRSEGSYSFIFADYNCSVEFFRTPFLVQEWEVLDKNGSKTETLRLDLVENSSDRYRDADVLIFNTGHWWSHEKTSRGQGYYQEGSHVYDELNVIEAFRRALTTWARWVDANVDHKKTQVFFRGYSSSHFGGGKWNSGGRCDEETEPFKDDAYLESYPSNMIVLEDVLRWMKMPVFYLNITRLTDFRKDAHPAIYRAQHLSEEERRSPLRYQDCSHWCLPGVPDTWNEIVYSQMLIRHHQRLEEEQQIGQRH